ncbi:transient receptor potential cation channel subfamily V member 1-like isoform X3 [Periophthalmus magnuspinnatus]|uniref:transient receptor potential cation channel subfamily V member 1-like isoform X3 n=1 Tax=Periophthalmus magnuspinnatus TaxID=409849 RepID=UPI0024365276|nr:transient receptor potential cation channel subfamily V member 1-like isoform X3 [Periophthalmus magnuspinnatus]
MEDQQCLEVAAQEQRHSLDWLLGGEPPDTLPMDTIVSVSSGEAALFSRELVFGAASRGDVSQLRGLLDFLTATNKRLTSPEFTESNGKTALLKALLNLKNDKNDAIRVLLDIAEKTGDLKKLINASYTDNYYHGQTALHVAIERRSLDHVKLLVEKGADVQVKANGKFFQLNEESGFYFGELPLSLAACTNQPEVVSYLLDNPHRQADVADRDSDGNTVLHALVVIADNSPENTDMIADMYNKILTEHHILHRDSPVRLEDIKNNQGLTPLKLAAKLGRIGLLKHMLHRELLDKGSRPLSRKFTEWVYGPVHSSLYDTSSIDTDEDNSVLEIIVFGSKIPNRTEMLQLEPLCSLLKDKWERFASKLFLFNFLVYMVYLIIFTAVAINRKEGKPPFPIEDVPDDYLRSTGQVISVLGGLWFFYKSVVIFRKNPPKFSSLYTDGFCDILFFFQGTLILLCVPLYLCGLREYVGLQVISLALAWVNTLYYARGIKQLGIYSVMMQRMILRDLLHFLCVYAVFLFGFSAAIVSLIEENYPADEEHTSRSKALGRGVSPEMILCEKPSYNDFSFTILELFKFTIGMGDLEFTDHVQYKEVFYILLIFYIVLTYILLLNMLIAIMGNTVERISSESENIWNLQRSLTILDLESSLPQWLKEKLYSGKSKIIIKPNINKEQSQRLLRVEEVNWTKWRSDLHVFQQEDPGGHMTTEPQSKGGPQWNFNLFKERLWRRNNQSQGYNFPTI